MSQIRIAKAVDTAAFPGATFVVDGSPPITQCEETLIADGVPEWTATESTITISISLAAIDVVGSICRIIDSASDNGDWDIIAQNGQILTLDHVFVGLPGIATAVLRETAGAYLTRSQASFQKYIETQSKAHTTKGGQLYTDITDPPINGACSNTWNPE